MAKFYTLDEAARTLGIPPERLQAWIVEGRALATRRSGSWVIRDFEIRKLKKSMASSTAHEQPASRPTSLPLPEGRSASRPTSLPLREEEPPSRPASLPLREEEPPSRPSSLPIREEVPVLTPTSLPLPEGRSIPPPVAPPSSVRPPAPPGLGFNERRRTLGRRREDVFNGASLLECFEKTLREALQPLTEGQQALSARLEGVPADLSRTLEELLSRATSRLEEVLKAPRAGEVENLRSRIAQLQASPAREEQLSKAFEGLRHSTEQAIQGLRSELTRALASPTPSAPAGLGEERDRWRQDLDRTRQERDRLRQERERLVDELAAARTDSEAHARLLEELRDERDHLAREREELRSALEKASQTGLNLGSERLGLEAERDALKVERDALELDRDRARAELARLRSERERQASEPAAFEGKGELTDLMRRLESLRKPLDAAGARPAELAERAARVLEESRDERQQLESRLQQSEQEIQELRSRLQATMERMQPLAADLSAARTEAGQAREELEELRDALEEERRQHQEQHASLLSARNSLESELAALKASQEEEGPTDEPQRPAPENPARLQGRINGLQRELDASRRQLAEAREAQARSSAEREAAAAKNRELQEQLKNLNYKLSVRGTETGLPDPRQMVATIARLEAETDEKDRLIQEGHRQRAELRTDLEKAQRAYYELQQRLDREKMEWSEILAREIAQRDEAQRSTHASEEDSSRRSSGWRLFKPRGGGS